MRLVYKRRRPPHSSHHCSDDTLPMRITHASTMALVAATPHPMSRNSTAVEPNLHNDHRQILEKGSLNDPIVQGKYMSDTMLFDQLTIDNERPKIQSRLE